MEPIVIATLVIVGLTMIMMLVVYYIMMCDCCRDEN